MAKWSYNAIYDSSSVFWKLKRSKAQIPRKNPAGGNPKWKQTKCQICSACEFITMWMSPLQNKISAALMHESGGCISGRDPPPILVHTSCPPEPPLPLPVLFPIAIMQWCHEESRKAVLTPSFLELKGRWIGRFNDSTQKCSTHCSWWDDEVNVWMWMLTSSLLLMLDKKIGLYINQNSCTAGNNDLKHIFVQDSVGNSSQLCLWTKMCVSILNFCPVLAIGHSVARSSIL